MCDGEMKMFLFDYDEVFEKLVVCVVEFYELIGGEYVDVDNFIEDVFFYD